MAAFLAQKAAIGQLDALHGSKASANALHPPKIVVWYIIYFRFQDVLHCNSALGPKYYPENMKGLSKSTVARPGV